MNIYFIRHGESEGNAQKLHQHTDAKLSRLGIAQAEFVAKRFLSIPIDSIVASDVERARHTAAIIGQTIGKEIIYTHTLREIRWPSEMVGKPSDDPEVVAIRKQVKENFGAKGWHYSDEENFYDAKKRVHDALAIIESQKQQDILVVTHGNFMRMIVGLLVFGKTLTPALFFALRESFSVRNTGITKCGRDLEGHWHLITWNDHAHLG